MLYVVYQGNNIYTVNNFTIYHLKRFCILKIVHKLYTVTALQKLENI